MFDLSCWDESNVRLVNISSGKELHNQTYFDANSHIVKFALPLRFWFLYVLKDPVSLTKFLFKIVSAHFCAISKLSLTVCTFSLKNLCQPTIEFLPKQPNFLRFRSNPPKHHSNITTITKSS